MKLLIESAMIFFGTLMAAGLVALGEPTGADAIAGEEFGFVQVVHQMLESGWSRVEQAALPVRSSR